MKTLKEAAATNFKAALETTENLAAHGHCETRIPHLWPLPWAVNMFKRLQVRAFGKAARRRGRNKQKACPWRLLERLSLQDYGGLWRTTQHTVSLAGPAEWNRRPSPEASGETEALRGTVCSLTQWFDAESAGLAHMNAEGEAGRLVAGGGVVAAACTQACGPSSVSPPSQPPPPGVWPFAAVSSRGRLMNVTDLQFW